MKPISRESIRNYFQEVLQKPAVMDVIEKSHNSRKPKLMSDFTPSCIFKDKITGYKVKVAGYALGTGSICLANWILRDSSQAKAVVRHEVAHLLQHYKYGESKPHGKEFTEALKVVSPKTWRRDKYWHDNPLIINARKECESNPNKIHLT